MSLTSVRLLTPDALTSAAPDEMTTGLLQLTTEVLNQILVSLPVDSLARAACVCRSLRSSVLVVLEKDAGFARTFAHRRAVHTSMQGIRPHVQRLLGNYCCSPDATEVLQLGEWVCA